MHFMTKTLIFNTGPFIVFKRIFDHCHILHIFQIPCCCSDHLVAWIAYHWCIMTLMEIANSEAAQKGHELCNSYKELQAQQQTCKRAYVCATGQDHTHSTNTNLTSHPPVVTARPAQLHSFPASSPAHLPAAV